MVDYGKFDKIVAEEAEAEAELAGVAPVVVEDEPPQGDDWVEDEDDRQQRARLQSSLQQASQRLMKATAEPPTLKKEERAELSMSATSERNAARAVFGDKDKCRELLRFVTVADRSIGNGRGGVPTHNLHRHGDMIGTLQGSPWLLHTEGDPVVSLMLRNGNGSPANEAPLQSVQALISLQRFLLDEDKQPQGGPDSPQMQLARKCIEAVNTLAAARKFGGAVPLFTAVCSPSGDERALAARAMYEKMDYAKEEILRPLTALDAELAGEDDELNATLRSVGLGFVVVLLAIMAAIYALARYRLQSPDLAVPPVMPPAPHMPVTTPLPTKQPDATDATDATKATGATQANSEL